MKTGIHLLETSMDSRSPIRSRTGFTGMTKEALADISATLGLKPLGGIGYLVSGIGLMVLHVALYISSPLELQK